MHMEWVQSLVQKSNEAWEELSGANRYAMKAQKAKEMANTEDMNMYLDMADQELGHADKIKTPAGDFWKGRELTKQKAHRCWRSCGPRWLSGRRDRHARSE